MATVARLCDADANVEERGASWLQINPFRILGLLSFSDYQ
jgi:hypothetical protein